jgi:hypothetical protein
MALLNGFEMASDEDEALMREIIAELGGTTNAEGINIKELFKMTLQSIR